MLGSGGTAMKRLIASGLAGFSLVLLLACFTQPSFPVQLQRGTASTAAGNLRQLCDRTVWIEGLWLQCHIGNIVGGLNNARNRLQTCLRLAIDAGATGMVLPPIR